MIVKRGSLSETDQSRCYNMSVLFLYIEWAHIYITDSFLRFANPLLIENILDCEKIFGVGGGRKDYCDNHIFI